MCLLQRKMIRYSSFMRCTHTVVACATSRAQSDVCVCVCADSKLVASSHIHAAPLSPVNHVSTLDTTETNPMGRRKYQSGTGLRHGKLSKEILKRAIGEPTRKAIAATQVSCVGAANLDAASAIAGSCKDALRHLCGSPSSGGQLQVTKPQLLL